MNRRNTGVPPDIIHFKHVHTNSIGVIPAPIHFKYVNEAVDRDSLQHITDWSLTDDNSHLANDPNYVLPTYRGSILDHAFKKQNEAVGNVLKDQYRDNPPDTKIKRAITSYTGYNTVNGSLSGLLGAKPAKSDWYSHIINKSLINKTPIKNRFIPTPTQMRLQSTIDGLDDAVKKHPIQNNYDVYSGLSFDPRDHLNENGIMNSPAYISTTHNKDKAYEFGTDAADASRQKEVHIMHLHLKSGDPAVHVAPFSYFPEEQETIIGRNTNLRHMGTQSYSSGGVLNRDQITHIHHFAIDRNK
jgi:hypothetical protein